MSLRSTFSPSAEQTYCCLRRAPSFLWSQLNEIAAFDSPAANSCTGTDTRPNETVAARPRVSVTTVLIVINVLVYVAMALRGVSPLAPTSLDLLTWGASFGPRELSTEWWRLFTAMFVHIGFLHILLNMYCLWSLGPLAERLF